MQYNLTKPTYPDGARGELQLGTRGSLHVSIVAEDSTASVSITPLNVDGNAAAINALRCASFGEIFNGTTWDRLVKANQTHRLLSAAASTNATSVKASAGNVFKVFGTSANAAARYLKFYNKASAPTVGSDTPVLTLYIPPNTVNGGVFSFSLDTQYFSAGIAYAMTTAAADADTGALTAGDVIAFNLTYS